MLIYEYKCDDCSAVFEHSNSIKGASCIMCESDDVKRVTETLFSPNKLFCPKEKKIKKRSIRDRLTDLFGEERGKCYDGCAKP